MQTLEVKLVNCDARQPLFSPGPPSESKVRLVQRFLGHDKQLRLVQLMHRTHSSASPPTFSHREGFFAAVCFFPDPFDRRLMASRPVYVSVALSAFVPLSHWGALKHAHAQ